MFHMEIHLDYGASEQIKKLDDVSYAELSEGFPNLDLPARPVDEKWSLGWNKREFVVDQVTMQLLIDNKVEFTVKRFKGQAKQTTTSVTQIHIALPNLGLLMVDEVKLLNDCCTDTLSDYLKDNWRIIAVCPPLDARRPDYIMGRSNYLHGRES